MILISHRGNISGRIERYENQPRYIDKAIELGYDVEIDVRYINETLWLGHDKPQYEISFDFLVKRVGKLWVHCKNVESVLFLQKNNHNINYFWHQEDDMTLTSLNHIWAFPGKQPIKNSISVMPEINNDDITQCLGICSDFISNYR